MNTTKIIDEFTNLPVSRERKKQLRHARDGLCFKCGNKAVSASMLCLKHLVWTREQQRRLKGCVRRNINSMSYNLQRTIK